MLNAVTRMEIDASVTPVGATPLWRARHGSWTHIGRFEDAVAHLASHVVEANTDVAELGTTVAKNQAVPTMPPEFRAGTAR